MEYNNGSAYNKSKTFYNVTLEYNNNLSYNETITYDNIEEIFQEIVASNFQPTFTGPPRDSGGITRTSLIIGHQRNKEEEELLSLLGYL
jgi:hypothetical protein